MGGGYVDEQPAALRDADGDAAQPGHALHRGELRRTLRPGARAALTARHPLQREKRRRASRSAEEVKALIGPRVPRCRSLKVGAKVDDQGAALDERWHPHGALDRGRATRRTLACPASPGRTSPRKRPAAIACMKIATWNVNSLRVRLPHLLDWLGRAFARRGVPAGDEVRRRDVSRAPSCEPPGYCSVHHGQKTYNGVAILAAPRACGRLPRHPRLRRRAEPRDRRRRRGRARW